MRYLFPEMKILHQGGTPRPSQQGVLIVGNLDTLITRETYAWLGCFWPQIRGFFILQM
jgi:hypothetical protein